MPDQSGLPSESLPSDQTVVKLITAHRILITAGIAFFLFYALFQLRLYMTRDAGVGALVQVGVSVAIVIGLSVYFRSLRGWGRR